MARTGRSFDFIDEFHLIKDRVRRLELRFHDPMMDAKASEFISYSVSGNLTVGTGGLRWYPVSSGSVGLVHVAVGTPSTSGSISVTVNKNGSPFNTVSIASGDHKNSSTPASPNFAEGDFFTVDITASGTGSKDLVVQLYLE